MNQNEINKLRSNLSTKAAHIIKNRYLDEFQEVYYTLLREHGLEPSTKAGHFQKLFEENRRLKQLLKEKEGE
jgi:hypothetical protein